MFISLQKLLKLMTQQENVDQYIPKDWLIIQHNNKTIKILEVTTTKTLPAIVCHYDDSTETVSVFTGPSPIGLNVSIYKQLSEEEVIHHVK